MTHLLDSTFQLPVKVASSNSPMHCSNSCTIALRGPKFKASETRKQSFDLLTTLSANNLANLKIILEYIHPLILSGDWRTSNSKHWEIVPKKNEKSSTGYVGLKNLGCSKINIILYKQGIVLLLWHELIAIMNDSKVVRFLSFSFWIL